MSSCVDVACGGSVEVAVGDHAEHARVDLGIAELVHVSCLLQVVEGDRDNADEFVTRAEDVRLDLRECIRAHLQWASVEAFDLLIAPTSGGAHLGDEGEIGTLDADAGLFIDLLDSNTDRILALVHHASNGFDNGAANWGAILLGQQCIAFALASSNHQNGNCITAEEDNARNRLSASAGLDVAVQQCKPEVGSKWEHAHDGDLGQGQLRMVKGGDEVAELLRLEGDLHLLLRHTGTWDNLLEIASAECNSKPIRRSSHCFTLTE